MKESTTQSLDDRPFLGYYRVSSKDQSRGTSLDEQKIYIEQYAHRKQFRIAEYIGGVESASKPGRKMFAELVEKLNSGKYRGAVFTKVDRSGRNPREQAVLYELMQKGCEFHFANEGVSTKEPMGRHMLYILWGMASAYTQNLTDGINTGITGRLKQGKWPGPVPIGYKRGSDPKDCLTVIDETRAPLVKLVFNEYATGKYTVARMLKFSKGIGLTNKGGRPLSKNSMHDLLRNTFYYGLITCKRGVFPGIHEPIISKALFDRVQFVLQDRGFKIVNKNTYVFQGLFKCGVCGKKFKAMTVKGKFKYYLCKNPECKTGTVSEVSLEKQLLEELKKIEFTEEESKGFVKAIYAFRKNAVESRQEQIAAIELEMKNIEARLEGLLQKFIEQKIDDETHMKTRQALLNKKIELKETRDNLEQTEDKTFGEMDELVKLLKSATAAYKNADWVSRRRLILSIWVKLEVKDKKLYVYWKKHFEMIANRPKLISGGDGGS